MLTDCYSGYSLQVPGNPAAPLSLPVFSIGRPHYEIVFSVVLYVAMLSVSRLHSAGGEFMNEIL
jgi:hypothetical protein